MPGERGDRLSLNYVRTEGNEGAQKAPSERLARGSHTRQMWAPFCPPRASFMFFNVSLQMWGAAQEGLAGRLSTCLLRSRAVSGSFPLACGLCAALSGALNPLPAPQSKLHLADRAS